MSILLFSTKVSWAQELEFVDLGVVEGEFNRYNRTLTWTSQGTDSLSIRLWSNSEDLSFEPIKRPIAGGEEVEIPISIALPDKAGDYEYELRVLDENDLVLHGFQMSFKVLQSELDVFKAYRNVHFPFRAKEEVFNLRSAKRGDTLTAVFDVYNLGGRDIKARELLAGDSIKVSFPTNEVAHNTFSKMRIEFITNDQSELGFEKRAIKVYDRQRLVTVLPVQYTLLPKPAGSVNGPKLSTSLINHDFKVVKEGQAKEVTVALANNGGAALMIEKIESSCECLSFNEIDQIDPGTSQSLRVKFNAEGRDGLERKTIAIFSNDPQKPVLVLTFRAHVK
ncbi:DUF1573 domain-containing protein [Roseivirga sp. 4D4]|uniref:DUF1573 domain-containing protein n=1 Tax=Roseivirga sp. 4D4 TaxID=1889784 RepID=UPI00147FB954|nr:DUF1573 domain-containing protein [Roseivirga sp. 4D4]